MSIVVSELDGTAPAAQPVEIVERKGLGHPDTLCEALAEEVSLALSRFYLEWFGFVLHHNVDKVLLRGGAARPAFAGGEVNEPIELYLAGRATREYGGVRIPVDQLAIAACRSWLSTNLHALDAEHHVRVHCLVRLAEGLMRSDVVVRGALAAAAGFLAPSLLLVLGLSWAYFIYGTNPEVRDLVVGLNGLVVGGARQRDLGFRCCARPRQAPRHRGAGRVRVLEARRYEQHAA